MRHPALLLLSVLIIIMMVLMGHNLQVIMTEQQQQQQQQTLRDDSRGCAGSSVSSSSSSISSSSSSHRNSGCTIDWVAVGMLLIALTSLFATAFNFQGPPASDGLPRGFGAPVSSTSMLDRLVQAIQNACSLNAFVTWEDKASAIAMFIYILYYCLRMQVTTIIHNWVIQCTYTYPHVHAYTL
jgi:hypothetical protein